MLACREQLHSQRVSLLYYYAFLQPHWTASVWGCKHGHSSIALRFRHFRLLHIYSSVIIVSFRLYCQSAIYVLLISTFFHMQLNSVLLHALLFKVRCFTLRFPSQVFSNNITSIQLYLVILVGMLMLWLKSSRACNQQRRRWCRSVLTEKESEISVLSWSQEGKTANVTSPGMLTREGFPHRSTVATQHRQRKQTKMFLMCVPASSTLC